MELRGIANRTKEMAKFGIDMVAGKAEQLASGANDLYAKVGVNITNAMDKVPNTGLASKALIATVATAAVLSAGSAEASMVADVVNQLPSADLTGLDSFAEQLQNVNGVGEEIALLKEGASPGASFLSEVKDLGFNYSESDVSWLEGAAGVEELSDEKALLSGFDQNVALDDNGTMQFKSGKFVGHIHENADGTYSGGVDIVFPKNDETAALSLKIENASSLESLKESLKDPISKLLNSGSAQENFSQEALDSGQELLKSIDMASSNYNVVLSNSEVGLGKLNGLFDTDSSQTRIADITNAIKSEDPSNLFKGNQLASIRPK